MTVCARFPSCAHRPCSQVLFYVADNMLSAKLETAIQALDNVTKVYFGFVQAEPLSSAPPVTPDGRYDVHLVPDAILTHAHDALNLSYNGISQNVAGLIEYILALKAVLKGVYTRNEVNETTFDAICKNFVYRTQQVRRFTSLFQSQVVHRSLDFIDARTDRIRQLNSTLLARRQQLDAQLHRHLRHLDTTYAHAHSDLRAFVQLASQFANQPPGGGGDDVSKLSLAEHAISDVTRAAVTSLATSSEQLRAGAEDVRSAWRALRETVADIWRTIIDEDLLRNFYMNLYSDVTDVATQPSRIESLRALLVHFRLTVPSELGRYAPKDLLAVFNADVPLVDVGVKLAEIDDEFRRLERQTDAEVVVGRRDRSLAVAYRALADNMVDFYAECELSADLIR